MAKMWAGRTDGLTDQIADDFNSSIHFDSRMYRQDITGSMEHATMLSVCGILTVEESTRIVDGLQEILDDLDEGKLQFDPDADWAKWIAELYQTATEKFENLPVVLGMTDLGGVLDVYAGNVQRAPKLWQKLGLEWTYRLIKEPWRFKRMARLPLVLVKAAKVRLSGGAKEEV
jgi:hypothetical protein